MSQEGGEKADHSSEGNLDCLGRAAVFSQLRIGKIIDPAARPLKCPFFTTSPCKNCSVIRGIDCAIVAVFMAGTLT